jgi:hypothetical protein
MTGIMRLSKKYEVDSLHKRALVHFASAFPLEAAEYPSSASWDRTDQDMRAVIFAREQALDWALPTAFYRVCAHNSVNEILNGIYVGNARVELNPKDKLMCLEQSLLLRGSASADVINFLWHPDRIEGCRSEKCRAERLGCRKIAEDWRARHFPITLWGKKDWDRLRSVCSICLTAMKTTHKGTIEKFWDGLPKRFGLVAWDELEEMKANLLADPNSLVPTESLIPTDDVINA